MESNIDNWLMMTFYDLNIESETYKTKLHILQANQNSDWKELVNADERIWQIQT